MAKVKFGLKNVYWHPLTEATAEGGAVAMQYGEAIRIPGAVNLTLDINQSDSEPFYADDSVYYLLPGTDDGRTGNLEVALFPDEIKTAAMNYIKDSNGVVLETTITSLIYGALTFEIATDTKARKFVYYKVGLGKPALSAATTAGSKTPQTETASVNCLPTTKTFTLTKDGETVITPLVSSYTTEDVNATAYADWNTTIYMPQEAQTAEG